MGVCSRVYKQCETSVERAEGDRRWRDVKGMLCVRRVLSLRSRRYGVVSILDYTTIETQ